MCLPWFYTLPKASTCCQEDIISARHKTGLAREVFLWGAVAIVAQFAFRWLASKRPKISASFHTYMLELTCKSIFTLKSRCGPQGRVTVLSNMQHSGALPWFCFYAKAETVCNLFGLCTTHPQVTTALKPPTAWEGRGVGFHQYQGTLRPQVLTPDSEDAGTSFFSRLHSDITLSPCSWKVMMINATKMFTKKKGKTTKYTT